MGEQISYPGRAGDNFSELTTACSEDPASILFFSIPHLLRPFFTGGFGGGGWGWGGIFHFRGMRHGFGPRTEDTHMTHLGHFA